MKKYVATVSVAVDADSLEARDAVVRRLVDGINKSPPAVWYDRSTLGEVRSATVTRIRPKAKKRA